MRKASMILGIIGGVIAILVALFAILGGLIFRTAVPSLMESDIYDEMITEYNEEMSDKIDGEIYTPDVDDFTEGYKVAGYMFIGIGGIIFISGLLGIIGGAIVKKNNIAAGIMMLIGSCITLFTLWSILSFPLLLLGGIFAFVKDNTVNQVQVQS